MKLNYNIIKKILFMFIIIVVISPFTYHMNSISHAVPSKQVLEKSRNQVSDNANTSFNPQDWKPNDLVEDQSVIDMANIIIGAFQAIGSIVSVLALIIIGIKYMMGSVEEKAANKEQLVYYVIGAVLVFSVSNIASVIYQWARTLNA